MSASPEPDDDGDLVARAARDAYEAAGGSIAEATRHMENAVRADRRLRDELTEPLLATACYDAVRMQCRAARHRVWSPSVRALARHRTDSRRRVMRAAQSALMRFPLPGGKHLGDATREEIAGAAETYTRQSDDMRWKGTWLALVAAAVPARRTAKNVLTEARLRELQEAARDA